MDDELHMLEKKNLLLNINFNEVKSIAIISRSMLGDLILTLCLFNYLEEQVPQAKITFFIDQKLKDLLPNFPSKRPFNVVLLPTRGRNNFQLFKIACKFRKQFDLVVSDKTSRPYRTLNLFMWMLGKNYRSGYVENNWHGRLIKHGLPFNRTEAVKYHHAVKVLRLVDGSVTTMPKKYWPKVRLENSLNSCNKIPQILISLSNNRFYADIGIQKYAEILNLLALNNTFIVVISALNTKENLEKANSLKNALHVSSVIKVTDTLNEFFALLAEVNLVFVGESGVMHMAATLDKPMLVLFGRTLIDEWRPLSAKTTIIFDPEDVKNIKNHVVVQHLAQLLSAISSLSGGVSG